MSKMEQLMRWRPLMPPWGAGSAVLSLRMFNIEQISSVRSWYFLVSKAAIVAPWAERRAHIAFTGDQMIEFDSSRAIAQIEEQRCLIEGQQVEIRRQQHWIEMQRRRVAFLEAEMEAIKLVLKRAPLRQPTTQRHASNKTKSPRCLSSDHRRSETAVQSGPPFD